MIAILVMLPLILMRNRRPRVLRPEYLWVLPLILMGFIGLGLWAMQMATDAPHRPFDAAAWLIIASSVVLGAAPGGCRRAEPTATWN